MTNVSYSQALEYGVQGCRVPHRPLVGEPENLRAKLLTLQEADEITKLPGEWTSYDLPMETLVWVVEMEGYFQLIGGPAPTQTPLGQTTTAVIVPTAAPWRDTCTAIIRADTGFVIGVR